MALKRVWIPSPNYSSRGGAGVRLIVLHTAEGARTIESLGGFFQGNVGASSHTGADDKENTVGEYVSRGNKAWTQANYNPSAVAIELCGFASWSTAEWNAHPNMLDNCAKWIAEEAAYFGIPIVRLSDSEAQGSGRGVCQHANLGAGGGGHWDCGSGFPMDRVLDMARGGSGAAPTEEKEFDMIASAVSDGGSLHVFWVEGTRTIKYKYQQSGKTEWKGGSQLCKAGRDVVGLSASLSNTGTLELFALLDDKKVYHTWQRKNETAWSGGKAGESIADLSPL